MRICVMTQKIHCVSGDYRKIDFHFINSTGWSISHKLTNYTFEKENFFENFFGVFCQYLFRFMAKKIASYKINCKILFTKIICAENWRIFVQKYTGWSTSKCKIWKLKFENMCDDTKKSLCQWWLQENRFSFYQQ